MGTVYLKDCKDKQKNHFHKLSYIFFVIILTVRMPICAFQHRTGIGCINLADVMGKVTGIPAGGPDFF